MASKTEATIVALESKIVLLEAQLASEAEKRRAQVQKCLNQDKMLKEAQSTIDEENRFVQLYKHMAKMVANQ